MSKNSAFRLIGDFGNKVGPLLSHTSSGNVAGTVLELGRLTLDLSKSISSYNNTKKQGIYLEEAINAEKAVINDRVEKAKLASKQYLEFLEKKLDLELEKERYSLELDFNKYKRFLQKSASAGLNQYEIDKRLDSLTKKLTTSVNSNLSIIENYLNSAREINDLSKVNDYLEKYRILQKKYNMYISKRIEV